MLGGLLGLFVCVLGHDVVFRMRTDAVPVLLLPAPAGCHAVSPMQNNCSRDKPHTTKLR